MIDLVLNSSLGLDVWFNFCVDIEVSYNHVMDLGPQLVIEVKYKAPI